MAKVIRAIKPNAGIRAKYRKRLVSLLDEMQRSVVWWIRAEYRQQETRIAQDASPASDLQDRLKRLFRYWTKRWRESAESFAREFVGSTRRRTEASMMQALKDAGFTVKMEGSRAMSDVARALFEENVNLIKSIPQHYFTEVTGLVQRSASMGRDVAFLTDELHKRYEITRRRQNLSPATSPTRRPRPLSGCRTRNSASPKASGYMCRERKRAAIPTSSWMGKSSSSRKGSTTLT